MQPKWCNEQKIKNVRGWSGESDQSTRSCQNMSLLLSISDQWLVSCTQTWTLILEKDTARLPVFPFREWEVKQNQCVRSAAILRLDGTRTHRWRNPESSSESGRLTRADRLLPLMVERKSSDLETFWPFFFYFFFNMVLKWVMWLLHDVQVSCLLWKKGFTNCIRNQKPDEAQLNRQVGLCYPVSRIKPD